MMNHTDSFGTRTRPIYLTLDLGAAYLGVRSKYMIIGLKSALKSYGG